MYVLKNCLFYIFEFALDHDLLQVTGPESLDISWAPPEQPNGVINGYELRRDGEVIYVGTETRYHDFTLSPNVEYSYTLRVNNSKGAASSAAATAKTHPSAPSGVGLPTLTPLGPNKVYHSTLPLLSNFTFIFQPVSCIWLFALPDESRVEFSSSPQWRHCELCCVSKRSSPAQHHQHCDHPRQESLLWQTNHPAWSCCLPQVSDNSTLLFKCF